MSRASVSPTVLPLAGVVIGACGTLLGQYLALRVGTEHGYDDVSGRKAAVHACSGVATDGHAVLRLG